MSGRVELVLIIRQETVILLRVKNISMCSCGCKSEVQ